MDPTEIFGGGDLSFAAKLVPVVGPCVMYDLYASSCCTEFV